jgi:hypothetical protein
MVSNYPLLLWNYLNSLLGWPSQYPGHFCQSVRWLFNYRIQNIVSAGTSISSKAQPLDLDYVESILNGALIDWSARNKLQLLKI